MRILCYSACVSVAVQGSFRMHESVVDDVTNRLLDKFIHLMISTHFLWTFVDNRDINCLVKTCFFPKQYETIMHRPGQG